jgi:hypothetical protein
MADEPNATTTNIFVVDAQICLVVYWILQQLPGKDDRRSW